MPAVGRLRYLDSMPGRRLDHRGAAGPPTLVLIHAFPLDARMWDPQRSLSNAGWRVITPQLRGFGEHPAADDPAARSMEDYAADIVDLLDALGIDMAVIGGLSLGGYVTFAVFRRAPGRFSAMVLADTRPQADTPEGLEGRKRMIQLVETGGARAVADEMMPKLVGETTRREHPEIVERVRAQILSSPTAAIDGAIRAMMSRPDSTPLLGAIHCPTLVIVGEQDVITPPDISRAMQQSVPGAELAVIRDAGHLSNLEQPGPFNAALAGFLANRVIM